MKRNGERDRRFGVVFVIFHGSACSVREEEGTVVRIGEKKEREERRLHAGRFLLPTRTVVFF